MRILVAEDNRVNQKLIYILLERDGHAVTMVSSGKAAVVAVETSPPFDLILMDIQMPEMDGFQATAAIRRLEREGHCRVPIVALTAHAQAGFMQVCLDAGMDAYLTKPIDRRALREMLQKISETPDRETPDKRKHPWIERTGRAGFSDARNKEQI